MLYLVSKMALPKFHILQQYLIHERYLSTDLHFLYATAVWGESLNNFENFKKL